MDIVECLMKAGFTRHEAMLYIALCQEGELTGYEAAKTSGIPRSNAYLALAGLVDKGGALRIDGDSSKYAAVPAEELVFNLRKDVEQVYQYIAKNAPVREASNEPYFTITGRENIINKMSYLISHARERIYISTSPAELEFVSGELAIAKDKGLKVVIITAQGFVLEGVTIYRNNKQPGQIRLIADTAHVLTGELKGTGESTCLYSKNRNLIQLIRESLTNEIKLIKINSREA
jgi:sugar-specific transcriptional regulator TrmB